MMDRKDKDAGEGFADVNHFTAGFWGGRLNFQINIRRRILGTITRRNSTEPRESFVETMKRVLGSLDHIALTTEQNPVYQVRYQRNFQQEEELYNPTSFNISTFAYAPGMTTEESLERRISTLAESVRESRNLGRERSFVIEKQIPFTSNLIEDEDLPEYALEFFQALEPVYHEF
jgi:hypothetical protein